MSDEEKTQEADKGVEKEVDETKTSIDRAELDRLRQKGTDFDKLDHIAKAADFNSPKEYLENLEDSNWDKLQNAVTTEEKKEEKKEPESKEVKPVVEDTKYQQIQQGNTQAILASQWATYRLDQADAPKEDRSTVTKTEMDKLIYDPSTNIMIGKLAQKFDGNVYAAANHYLTITDATEKARKEGANTQKALDNAAASTELGTGGQIKEPEKKTPEQKAADENQQRADEIMPDHKYEYSGP